MLKILNESLSVISMEILKSVKVDKINKIDEKVIKNRKYKSKKAEEYANEHGITIDEFEMSEISKKDVENKVKEKAKEINIKNEKSVKKETKTVVKKERVICSGIHKKGEACKSTGVIQPEGSKRKYCFRHAEDWRSIECDTDSSESELEEEEYKN